MFFIVTGKCQVSITLFNSKEKFNDNFLTWGDHFGEIGCLYETRRTCTVSSMDFCILARLTKLKLRELSSSYPLFRKELEKCVLKYRDCFKDFMFQSLSRVEYLRNLGAKQMHKVIYAFREKQIERGHIILRPGKPVNSMVVVADGQLEIVTEVDGFEIVLVRLCKGSVLCHRTFFENEE